MLMGFNDAAADDQILDPNLVPYLGKPVYWRLVDTKKKAMTYAAGGFHVSVARGVSGGCSDPASASSPAVYGPAAPCPNPRNDPAARAAWAEAARRYRQVFINTKTLDLPLATIKSQLDDANRAAEAAYDQEGIPVEQRPRDPQRPNGPPEPVVTTSRRRDYYIVGGVAAAALVTALIMGGTTKKPSDTLYNPYVF